jgi:DNA polymerase-3 subunit delta'
MNELQKRLEASILAGRALHAYLFTGVDPDMTAGAARSAASLMHYGRRDLARLEMDPDHFEYEGNVSVSDFRDVIRPEIYRETFGKTGRTVVFKNAHLLSQMVQNAMLKVLEEPPEKTHFILTGNEYGILPTIRSRCMIMRFPAADKEEIKLLLMAEGASESEAERFAAMSGGVAARAKRLYSDAGFRELRSSAISAFLSAMAGAPDMKWSKVKREKAELVECNELMLLSAHDMLLLSCGLGPEYCPDRADALKKVSSRFTIGELSSIIDKLRDNAERLASNASGAAAFDRLFAEIGLIGLSKRG